MATSPLRTTQAGRNVLGPGEDGLRVTQAGRNVLGSGEDGLRVTQAGRNVLHVQAEPSRPSILSVTDITSYRATVTSSVYYHPGGDAHAGSRFQVRQDGREDWAELVYDSGQLGAVEECVVEGLSELGLYEVRVAYMDEDGDWSDWSLPYGFQASDEEDQGVPFEWDTHAQMWNIERSFYVDRYFNPGGWWKVEDRTPSIHTILRTCIRPYDGHVSSFGRLLGPPSALVHTPLPNRGVDVSCQLSWWSGEGGYIWQRFWDCQLARHGVTALVCGTAEARDADAVYNVWKPYDPEQWRFTEDFQGVFAFIEPRWIWPFNTCYCFGESSSRLIDCFLYGDGKKPVLHVVVFHQGQRVHSRIVELPWEVVFSSYYCPQCIYPWYAIRLKVWRDYDADPTGKTHRIQAAVNEPSGELATGWAPASIPAGDEWDIDTTWVGGYEESSPGAGDGGLRCGYSGYGSDRWTGAIPTITWGGQVYRNLSITPLETEHCGSPCEAQRLAAEEEPEISEPNEVTGFVECPPEVEGAFRNLFLGGHGSPGATYQFGGYEVQDGNPVVARIRPNPVAPMGWDGQALFRSIFVAVEHMGDIAIAITPILNGERLERYRLEKMFVGPGDHVKVQRYEMPLHRSYADPVVGGEDDERFKYGLRGTYLTFEMEIVDICGLGLTMPGVEIEWSPVRDALEQGIVYTEDLRVTPAFEPTGETFVGVKGAGRLLRSQAGTTDDEDASPWRARSNPVAPEGVGGECAFKRFAMVVTRWNGDPMEIDVTPVVDDEELAPVTLTFQPTTAPVTEIVPVPISAYHVRTDGTERLRHHPRGCWIWFKIEGDELQEWLTLEGGTLDYDTVRESLQEDVR